MCKSLSDRGFSVNLVVADGKGEAHSGGVNIIDVGKGSGGRISRMTKVAWSVLKEAVSRKSDLYHIHDPELIPVGIVLKLMKRRVIFDAHEDLPKQILSKPYLSRFSRIVLHAFATIVEVSSLRFFDGLIGATPAIANKLSRFNRNTETINNYPLVDELFYNDNNSVPRRELAYVGGLSEVRGIKELINAMPQTTGVTLKIAGEFNDPKFELSVKQLDGWSKVQHLGQISRSEVKSMLSKSFAGVVNFLPYPNHIEARPNKMFEYMSAGLPTIASNFSLWREIIEGNNCGICVDPLDPTAIAAAIDTLAQDPERARQMGQNGQKAVLEKFNWSSEEKKLLSLYENLLYERS
jgi:glycosyltransferase involved in cell wall biosynthesis